MRSDGTADPFANIVEQYDRHMQEENERRLKQEVNRRVFEGPGTVERMLDGDLPRCDAPPPGFKDVWVGTLGQSTADIMRQQKQLAMTGTPAEQLKSAEDRASELLDTVPRSVLLVVYKLLHAQDVRIAGIDHTIKEELKREEQL